MVDDQAFTHDPPYPKNYASEFLVLDHGDGVYLVDRSGTRYLDFGSGIAVNALGYGRDDLPEIVAAQMRKLIHVSNLYTTEPTLELASRLTEAGDFAAVHFGNSGTEATEAALKYARLYARRTKGPGHHRLVCFTGGFHGRSMGALAVTPTKKYQEPFEPLMPGVTVLPFNDVEALEASMDETVAGIIVEVVQGEGGLDVMTPAFAEALNRQRDAHDAILIDDEVQAGLGRTGRLFAHGLVGLRPDVVTSPKPLAAGLPLSATLTPEKTTRLLHVGEHGTTFGGGPVTCAAACHVWDTVTAPGFLDAVRQRSSVLEEELTSIADTHDSVVGLRGAGLLRGLALDIPEGLEADTMAKTLGEARSAGILVLKSGPNVLRVAPPLVITETEIREGGRMLRKVVEHLDSIL